jgi:hypothetical protein
VNLQTQAAARRYRDNPSLIDEERRQRVNGYGLTRYDRSTGRQKTMPLVQAFNEAARLICGMHATTRPRDLYFSCHQKSSSKVRMLFWTKPTPICKHNSYVFIGTYGRDADLLRLLEDLRATGVFTEGEKDEA